jgi:hypothetical protein
MALIEVITAVTGSAAGVVCAIPVATKWVRRRR